MVPGADSIIEHEYELELKVAVEIDSRLAFGYPDIVVEQTSSLFRISKSVSNDEQQSLLYHVGRGEVLFSTATA